MATTRAIVEQIKGHLASRMPGLAVEYIPDKPDSYRLNHPTGALLISYAGTEYGPTQSSALAIQPGMAVFTIVVTARKLNDTNGALDLLDSLRPVMQGFKPPGCKPFVLLNDHFVGQVGGIWQYALDVGTETVFIPAQQEVIGAVITAVNFEE